MTDHEQDGFDLDPDEIRVLGVLIEKAFLTPDNYPLSLNAILGGANQLTAREPVMRLDESTTQAAIDRLMTRGLVTRRQQASARVAKYEHQIRLRHSLPPAEQAVLATLLLRGAQTAGEIRTRCERMHHFDNIEAVEQLLEHLGDKYPPMVLPLPRAPGTKETRFVHLLGGPPDAATLAAYAKGEGGDSVVRRGRSELEEEVRELREALQTLREDFERFRAEFR